MNLFKTRILPFLILAILALGCRSCDTVESSKVAQSEIYQDYSVVASTSGSTATAFFRVGGSTGTTIDLVPPSKIELNGAEMTGHPRSFLDGSNYTLPSDAANGLFRFSYTNGDGQVFENEIGFEPIELVSVPASIDTKQKTVISLSRPLSNGETIETSIVSLESRSQNEHANTPANNLPANNDYIPPVYQIGLYHNVASRPIAIEITPGALGNFAPGKAEISIRVSASRDLEQKSHVGGVISYRFSSPVYRTSIIR